MSRHLEERPVSTSRAARRTAAGVAFALTGLAVTGAGVYAALNANAFNTSPQSVSSGTLKLVLSDNGNGFSTSISGMAPGDTFNRYVDLTNSGTLDGKNITFKAVDSSNTTLSTDATKGLQITIKQCSTSWTASTGVCTSSGTVTTLLSQTALANLGSATSLIAGSITAGNVYHLQVGIALPDATETTSNGTLPVGTIQGLTANVTYTFAETQRDAATNNS